MKHYKTPKIQDGMMENPDVFILSYINIVLHSITVDISSVEERREIHEGNFDKLPRLI